MDPGAPQPGESFAAGCFFGLGVESKFSFFFVFLCFLCFFLLFFVSVVFVHVFVSLFWGRFWCFLFKKMCCFFP